MTGPPPKPTKLRTLAGNPGKRRINPNEPKPKRARLSCPRWLSADGRRAWRELVPLLDGMQVLTTADRMALTMLCDAYSEWLTAREVIQDKGETYETETTNGSVKYSPRPEVAHAADAWRRVKSMLAEFGLTPASRSRLSVESPTEDPLEEFLKRDRYSS